MAFPSETTAVAEPIELPEDVQGAKRVLAVGGGRGGVGKSLIAQNLAVYLAQLGKSVVLVDADPTGANLHLGFGLVASTQAPPLDAGAQNVFSASLLPTNVPGLRLLAAPHDAPEAGPALRAGRKAKWLSRLRGTRADFVIIDVGPGHGHFALDVMLTADLSICVTVPEPPAIETTYRFLRAAFRRRVRRAIVRDRLRSGFFHRALAEVGPMPAPLDLVRAFSKMDRTLAELAWSEAQRFRQWLVVNQTRVRADVELGAAMSGLSMRHYGLALEELGHIEHDDAVWLAVRRNRPLLIDSATSKAARNVERIARRILALLTTRAERREAPPPLPPERPNLYGVLGVTPSATDEEIRRAYKRQREIYATGSLATSSLMGTERIRDVQLQVEEAHDTLLDPARRRTYDLSTLPDPDEKSEDAAPLRAALAAEQLLLQAELAREIGPDTEFTGSLLRKVRESQGIEVAEIAARTKIARVHLDAIEDEKFSSLPATVYVRGFLSEVAKYLRLDPAQVQRTYLRRMRESMRE